jgi:WD40 repeat protein/transcriptional regulator with XRE-family HTH domain
MPAKSVLIALDRFTTFGDLLKYLRRRAGLTQRELSIAVNYSDAQISRLEQNERLPDLATLAARFLPVLDLEDQPLAAERLLELAASMRREDAPAVGLPPYKGLQHFDEQDAELFFGREALIAHLVQRLAEQLASDQRLLAIIGASGSGKSSLVRAGLIPALRWQPPSSAWPVVLLTPTAHPLESLATSLSHERIPSLLPQLTVESLAGSPQVLADIQAKLARSASAANTILVVDQFEEVFTLCRSADQQAAFVDNLIQAALAPGGVALIIIVLRADFYAHCARFNRLRQAIASHQEYIGPMTGDELRRAIEEPARRAHWELEPGLADLMLHDVGADSGHTPEPGALPLLSHALLATWQRRRGRTLTLSGYTASGGVRGAIAETAEAVFYDRLDPEQRLVARQIFLRLTELGGDAATADTRRRVNFAELVSTPDKRQIVDEVLLALADARLITTDQDSAEVAHEALIREWPTLRNWLEEDREGLRLHRRLTETAQEWNTQARDPSILYRGARLAQAIEWAAAHTEQVNLLENEFLAASQALLEREASEREAQRQRELQAAQHLAETERARAAEQTHASQRLRQRAVFLSIALLLVGVLAITALLFGQRALHANRLASSRELAAAAISNLAVDPERSVLLALYALDQSDTLEARNALRQALPELHVLRVIPAHRQSPGVAYSPDGARITTIGVDGDAKIWDAATGQELLSLSFTPEPGLGIAYSPDGSWIATVSNSHLIIWDAAHSRAALTLIGNLSQGTINRASFSPDSRRVAVANLDGSPRVWDLSTGQELLSLHGHAAICDAIAFSPDGQQIATGDQSGVIQVWDSTSGQVLLSFGQGGVIHDLAYSPDGSRLATANEDGTLVIWEPASGQPLLSLPRLPGMYGVTFLSNSLRLVTTHQDGTAKVWDATTGQLLLTLAGHVSTVVDVASSPDGAQIATAGYDGSLRIWDAAPGRELTTLYAHTDQAWEVRYSPDGARLATVGLDGFARQWDARTGRLLLELAPGEPLNSLTYSPDGRALAAGGMDGSVFVWDALTGQPLLSAAAHQALVSGEAFSPDGRFLVSGSWDGTQKVWQLSTGQVISTFTGHTLGFGAGITFSPDGGSVFSGGADGYARQWQAAGAEQINEFSSEGREIYGLALSPDGSLLALGLQDGEIELWDTAKNTLVQRLTGHAGLVFRLAFSPDGTRLASAAFDRLAKVWDVPSGAELFSLYGNPSNVFGVAFSPDGQTLASVGADGSLRTYTLSMETLITHAKARLTRSLTEAECEKFLHTTPCPALPP